MNGEHHLADAASTERAGAVFARALRARPGLCVYLQGELGAGKTTFVRGWLRALGIGGSIRSPTYTLLEPYQDGARDILHMDLYRLREPAELEGLGLDSWPPDRAWWLVEWPERGGGHLPSADLVILLQAHESGRLLHWETAGALAAWRPDFEGGPGDTYRENFN